MASWREKKAAARRVVHDTMKVACVYLANGLPYDSNSGQDLPIVYPRLHLSDKALGDQAGTSLNSAERVEPTPKAVFWKADLEAAGITLVRNAVLSVSDGEAYTIDHAEPHDIETITAHLSRMDEADAEGLPLPEEV